MRAATSGRPVYALTLGPTGGKVRRVSVVKSSVKSAPVKKTGEKQWWSRRNAGEWITIPEAARELDVYPSSLYNHSKLLSPWLDYNDDGELVLHKNALTYPANQSRFKAARINKSMREHKIEDQAKRQEERLAREKDGRQARFDDAVQKVVAESKPKSDAMGAIDEETWLSTTKLRSEYGIPTHRLYMNHDLLREYIVKPDGKHYFYHRSLLENHVIMQYLKRPRGEMSSPPAKSTAKKAAKSAVEVVASAPDIDHAALPTPEITPMAVNRKVYCKELDRTYDSITLAAKAIGTRREALSKALRAGQRCRGYTFTYVDDGHEAPVQRKEKRAPTGCAVPKKVFCVDLNRAFNSLQEGAEAIGSTASALSAALRFGHRCKGHVFKYVDDPQRSDVQTRPVYCRELDKIFPSITAAAKAVNRSVPTMLGAIEKNYLCGGYHFTYA